MSVYDFLRLPIRPLSHFVGMEKRVRRAQSTHVGQQPSSKSCRLDIQLNPRRVRVLKEANLPPTNKPVLYWMSREMRVGDNWALLHAAEEAERTNSPLGVVYNLVDAFLGAGSRQFGFMLRGLRLMEPQLQQRNIPFFFLRGDPADTIPGLVQGCDARLLVVDYSPMRIGREWRAAVGDKISCPLHEVDAHNIVPVWITSNKREHAAYTIRPKIKSHLTEFMTEFSPLGSFAKESWSKEHLPETIPWDQILQEALERGKHIPEVDWIQPGEAAGRQALQDFLQSKRLSLYATKRNDPTVPEAQSHLSPYFHFGFLAPQRAAIEAKKCESRFKDSVDQFLEELIIRRELSDNFCHYDPDYDKFDAAADWAKLTLQTHASDPRDFVYTRDQLEHAQTHESLWNACQKELVHWGKLHGYMRMYWAKKILDWTASPQEALEIAMYLNDKYLLDGRDPNGYVGCHWSITGVHDHGFAEREVSGKIRPMTYSGCRRKFNIAEYVNRIEEIVKSVKGEDTG